MFWELLQLSCQFLKLSKMVVIRHFLLFYRTEPKIDNSKVLCIHQQVHGDPPLVFAVFWPWQPSGQIRKKFETKFSVICSNTLLGFDQNRDRLLMTKTDSSEFKYPTPTKVCFAKLRNWPFTKPCPVYSRWYFSYQSSVRTTANVHRRNWKIQQSKICLCDYITRSKIYKSRQNIFQLPIVNFIARLPFLSQIKHLWYETISDEYSFEWVVWGMYACTRATAKLF